MLGLAIAVLLSLTSPLPGANRCLTKMVRFGLSLMAKFIIFNPCGQIWKDEAIDSNQIQIQKSLFIFGRSTARIAFSTSEVCLLLPFGMRENKNFSSLAIELAKSRLN